MTQINARDLFHIRDSAIRHYVDMPARARMTGMDRDLTDDEKRSLSYLEACIETLVRAGAMSPDDAAVVTPGIYQFTYAHDLIEDV